MVAALTIPTLISNYQKNQYVTQLKKNYNVIQNGFRQYLATQGVMKLTDTKLFTSINGYGTYEDGQSAFQAELATIFKITKQYEFGTQTNNPDFSVFGGLDLFNNSTFILTDGSIVFYYCYKNEQLSESYSSEQIKQAGGKMYNYVCTIAIDVNGFKKPNKWGRDVFSFFMDNNGTLFPDGGSDYSVFRRGDKTSYSWKNADDTDYSSCNFNHTYPYKYGCAARIIEEGWKMNY